MNKDLIKFIKSDRTNAVKILNLNFDEDEEISRGLPWSSLQIEHDYITLEDIESMGFENISQTDYDNISTYSTAFYGSQIGGRNDRTRESMSKKKSYSPNNFMPKLESAKNFMTKFSFSWKMKKKIKVQFQR